MAVAMAVAVARVRYDPAAARQQETGSRKQAAGGRWLAQAGTRHGARSVGPAAAGRPGAALASPTVRALRRLSSSPAQVRATPRPSTSRWAPAAQFPAACAPDQGFDPGLPVRECRARPACRPTRHASQRHAQLDAATAGRWHHVAPLQPTPTARHTMAVVAGLRPVRRPELVDRTQTSPTFSRSWCTKRLKFAMSQ